MIFPFVLERSKTSSFGSYLTIQTVLSVCPDASQRPFFVSESLMLTFSRLRPPFSARNRPETAFPQRHLSFRAHRNRIKTLRIFNCTVASFFVSENLMLTFSRLRPLSLHVNRPETVFPQRHLSFRTPPQPDKNFPHF